MSRALSATMLANVILSAAVGALLWVMPGRFLGLLGWDVVEPMFARLTGAAFLGLAWMSFRGWQAGDRDIITPIVEMEAAFAVLAAIGFLRHLLIAYYPPIAWAVFIILVASAAIWIFWWFKK